MAKLVFIGEDVKEIPLFGIFKPGDEVDFNQQLLSTGLFSEVIDENQNNKEVGA